MTHRRQTRRATHRRAWQRRLRRWSHTCGMIAAAVSRRSARWLARRRSLASPAVIMLGHQPGGRRRRRVVSQAARTYARALGSPLPSHTTIILMPAVIEDERLHGLVEVFAPLGGPQRTLILLATRPHGQPVSEDDLLAVLRRQVTVLSEATIGRPVVHLRVALTAPVALPPAGGTVVPLRPLAGGYRNGVVPPGRHGPSGPTSFNQWPDDDPA